MMQPDNAAAMANAPAILRLRFIQDLFMAVLLSNAENRVKMWRRHVR